MGCVECKFFKQEEEKNQFEYPKNIQNKKINSLENSFDDKNNNNINNFVEEFEDKIKFIGQFISEEEFENMIPEETNTLMKNEPYQMKLKNGILIK